MSRQILHMSDQRATVGQKRITAICGLRVPPCRTIARVKDYPYPSCVACRTILIEREKEAARFQAELARLRGGR